MLRMEELVFEVTQEADGGFVAECLTEAIFTQADNWEELRTNALEAVKAFFGDSDRPASIRLHLVRDEVLATG
jgi:predicted RNase H-like HicB family nuclease